MEGNSDAIYYALELDLTRGNPHDPAAKALLRSLFKKFEDDSSESADAAAIQKFVSVNEQCGRFKWGEMQEWEYEMLGTLREYLWHFFHPTGVGHILSFDAAFAKGHAGPGASIGAKGEDFYTKHFDSTLTYTHQSRFLVQMYQRHVGDSPSWKSAEILRQSIYGFTSVPGSSLSTVPKNVDISRTICTEPSLLMFYQLGMGEVMADRLREWGLDIDHQALLNRKLARVGSLDGTFGTIDLASASDSLSIGMLRAVLPQDIFTILWSLRCNETRLPDGSQIELNMLSTMGNGYTFPLQTVLFTCVVLSVYKCLGIRSRKRASAYEDGVISQDNWAVFGDDIIVRREAYKHVCRLLQLLGFVVNTEKSFNEGPFRESCGADWYRGRDIRGVYCKTLKGVGSRFSLINRLLSWSSRHDFFLKETMAVLLKTVPVVPIPFLESEDAGVRVPSDHAQFFRTKSGMLAYLKYAKQGPKLRFQGSEVIRTPRKKGSKARLYNEYGLVVSLLHGSFRDGAVSLRASAREDRYHRCRGYCHNWDSLTRVPSPDKERWLSRLVPVLSPGDWQRWRNAVCSHLVSM